MKLFSKLISSPVGPLHLAANESGIAAVQWNPGPWFEQAEAGDSMPLLQRLERQLTEYFEGRRSKFDLPVDLRGTDFQLEVWGALIRIPYGRTLSYKQLAEAVRQPKAYRAVGLANGRNPVAIVVPCHRVIGADGGLTGFAGGLPHKRFLLDLESRHGASQLQLF